MNPYKITHSSLVFHLAYAIIQYSILTICNPRETKVAKTSHNGYCSDHSPGLGYSELLGGISHFIVEQRYREYSDL